VPVLLRVIARVVPLSSFDPVAVQRKELLPAGFHPMVLEYLQAARINVNARQVKLAESDKFTERKRAHVGASSSSSSMSMSMTMAADDGAAVAASAKSAGAASGAAAVGASHSDLEEPSAKRLKVQHVAS
jgi:hypothetical protein